MLRLLRFTTHREPVQLNVLDSSYAYSHIKERYFFFMYLRYQGSIGHRIYWEFISQSVRCLCASLIKGFLSMRYCQYKRGISQGGHFFIALDFCPETVSGYQCVINGYPGNLLRDSDEFFLLCQCRITAFYSAEFTMVSYTLLPHLIASRIHGRV